MHVHVIPTNSMSQLSFANAAASVDPAELDAAADAIRAELPAMAIRVSRHRVLTTGVRSRHSDVESTARSAPGPCCARC